MGTVREIDTLLEREPTKRTWRHLVEVLLRQLEEVIVARGDAAGPELPTTAQPFPGFSALSRIEM